MLTAASQSGGSGHAFRTLALFERIRQDFPESRALVQMQGLPWLKDFLSSRRMELHPSRAISETDLRGFDVIVIDGPISVTPGAGRALRSRGIIVASIIDSSPARPNSRVIVDPNFGACLSSCSYPEAVLLAGVEYALVRSEFLALRKIRIPELSLRLQDPRHPRILIMIGGTDPRGVGPRLGRKLSRAFPQLSFSVLTQLKARTSPGSSDTTYANLRLIPNTPHICEVLARHHLVITSGGTSMLDLLASGVPAVIFPTEPDQDEVVIHASKRGLVSRLAPFSTARDVGRDLVSNFEVIVSDWGSLRSKAIKASRVVDGEGSSRILAAVQTLAESPGAGG